MFGFPIPQILQFLGVEIPDWMYEQSGTSTDLGQCQKSAEAFFEAEDYEQAENCFKKIIDSKGSFTNEESCHFWMRCIDSQLRQKKILQAISSCLLAIKQLPEMDDLYRKLVDIYIPHGDLFFQNLTQLQQYFGWQTCYAQDNRTNEDILKILFDFFDYTTKRSAIIHDLFKDVITNNEIRDQLVDFLSRFLSRKVDVLMPQVEKIAQELGVINKRLEEEITSRQELDDLTEKVHLIKQRLLGGPGSEIPSGFFGYVQMYGAIVESYEKHYDDSRFPRLHQKFSTISSNARQLIGQLLHEGNQAGICQRLQRARMSIQTTSSEEEISTCEWIRRGNLMKYLFTQFQLPEKDALSALSSTGICVDDLFACDIMDHAVGESVQGPNEQIELDAFFKKNGLHTLENVKIYINNAEHKRLKVQEIHI